MSLYFDGFLAGTVFFSLIYFEVQLIKLLRGWISCSKGIITEK